MNSGYSIWTNFFFVLFQSGHFYNIVSTFTNLVKLDVENDNFVLTLSKVVHVNVEIHNVDLALLEVVNFNVKIHNVVSTLTWRCPTSRRRINQKTTLKQHWNVCWGTLSCNFSEHMFLPWFKVKYIFYVDKYISWALENMTELNSLFQLTATGLLSSTGAAKGEVQQWSYFHIAIIFK